MLDQVRVLIEKAVRLRQPAATLADDEDLFAAGLDAHDVVRLMLALEDAFQIEFPERMLNRANFASIEAISLSVAEVFPSKLRPFRETPAERIERAA